jgi:hypothetical protein
MWAWGPLKARQVCVLPPPQRAGPSRRARHPPGRPVGTRNTAGTAFLVTERMNRVMFLSLIGMLAPKCFPSHHGMTPWLGVTF